MKKMLTVLSIVLLVTTNCNSSKTDKYSSSSYGFNKTRGNSIDALYHQVLDENDNLNELNDQINEVLSSNNAQNDYKLLINAREAINRDLRALTNSIKDSSLHTLAEQLINNNLEVFHEKTSSLESNLKNKALEKIKIEDLYTVLKITKILPHLNKKDQQTIDKISNSTDLLSNEGLVSEIKNQLK